MLDALFSQLYFGQSLHTLQGGLPAIAGLLANYCNCLLAFCQVSVKKYE